MREAGCLGALLGAILGAVSGVCLALIIAQGNDIFAAMVMVLSVPISGILFLIIGIFLLRRLKKTFDSAPTTTAKDRIVTRSLITYFSLLASGMFSIYWTLQAPFDEIMLAHFAKNRASFETLQQMAIKDSKLNRVDDNWTDPENPEEIGVSVERIRTYRELCLKAGIPRGFNQYSRHPGIEFNYWLQGSIVSDSHTKGFLYATKPPKPIFKTLNTLGSHQNGFRHIQGNWYLFYECVPG